MSTPVIIRTSCVVEWLRGAEECDQIHRQHLFLRHLEAEIPSQEHFPSNETKRKSTITGQKIESVLYMRQ